MRIIKWLASALTALCLSSLSLAQKVTVTSYPLHTIGGKDTFIIQTSPYEYVNRADYLIVGGPPGSQYWGMMSWDMTKLSSLATGDKAELLFYGLNIPGFSPTGMELGMSGTAWSESVGWQSFTWYNTLTKIVPATPYDNWMTVDITNWYNYWKNGQVVNNGILFLPTSNTGKYTAPASSEMYVEWVRPYVRVTKVVQVVSTKFLDFPVSGYGPFMPGIVTSILDHEVPHDLSVAKIPFRQLSTTGPFGYSGATLSFTGELFVTTPQYTVGSQACYPKPANQWQGSTWSQVLNSIYGGTSGCTAGTELNYDNHPGYDYGIPSGTAVYPAADGTIVSTKCIRTFADVSSCEDYGAVAVDHGNGYVTQYLHMKNVYYGTVVTTGATQKVYKVGSSSQSKLGNVSNIGLGCNPGACVHLHFEVLKRKAVPVDTANYYNRANYVIVDPYGYKPGAPYADKLLANPGCLWNVGCQY